MKGISGVSLVLLVACLVPEVMGLVPPRRHPLAKSMSQITTLHGGASDPIDILQRFVTNSPLNEGKKALARMLAGDYDRTAIKSKLDKLIKDSPVLMLSFTTCPYCIKAKSILNEKGIPYQAVELDKDKDGSAMRAEMAELIGRTSVPSIWIGGVFIGGCNDGGMGGIVSLNANGKLDNMLKSVGLIN